MLQLNEPMADRQPEPYPAKAMALVVIFLDESVEDAAEHLRFNANAGVGDFYNKVSGVCGGLQVRTVTAPPRGVNLTARPNETKISCIVWFRRRSQRI